MRAAYAAASRPPRQSIGRTLAWSGSSRARALVSSWETTSRSPSTPSWCFNRKADSVARCRGAVRGFVLWCCVLLERAVSLEGFDEVVTRRRRLEPEELQGPAEWELDVGLLGAVGHLESSFPGELPATQG